MVILYSSTSNNKIMQHVRHRCPSMELEDSFCVLNGKPACINEKFAR